MAPNYNNGVALQQQLKGFRFELTSQMEASGGKMTDVCFNDELKAHYRYDPTSGATVDGYNFLDTGDGGLTRRVRCYAGDVTQVPCLPPIPPFQQISVVSNIATQPGGVLGGQMPVHTYNGNVYFFGDSNNVVGKNTSWATILNVSAGSSGYVSFYQNEAYLSDIFNLYIVNLDTGSITTQSLAPNFAYPPIGSDVNYIYFAVGTTVRRMNRLTYVWDPTPMTTPYNYFRIWNLSGTLFATSNSSFDKITTWGSIDSSYMPLLLSYGIIGVVVGYVGVNLLIYRTDDYSSSGQTFIELLDPAMNLLGSWLCPTSGFVCDACIVGDFVYFGSSEDPTAYRFDLVNTVFETLTPAPFIRGYYGVVNIGDNVYYVGTDENLSATTDGQEAGPDISSYPLPPIGFYDIIEGCGDFYFIDHLGNLTPILIGGSITASNGATIVGGDVQMEIDNLPILPTVDPATFYLPLSDGPGGDGKILLQDIIPSVANNHSRLIYVTENGDDATGVVYSYSKPFRNINNAMDVAVAGDTIIIFPGIYDGIVAWKSGVILHYMPGAVHTFNFTAGISSLFFTDDINATYKMTGHGRFATSGTKHSIVIDGTDNLNCNFDLECDSFEGSSLFFEQKSLSTNSIKINIRNHVNGSICSCPQSVVDFVKINASTNNNILTIANNDGNLTGNVTVTGCLKQAGSLSLALDFKDVYIDLNAVTSNNSYILDFASLLTGNVTVKGDYRVDAPTDAIFLPGVGNFFFDCKLQTQGATAITSASFFDVYGSIYSNVDVDGNTNVVGEKFVNPNFFISEKIH